VGYSPICKVERFEKVLEKILEKLNTGGKLNIYMAIILQNEPWDVLFLAAAVFKIAWK
jgi:hypothetical protein